MVEEIGPRRSFLEYSRQILRISGSVYIITPALVNPDGCCGSFLIPKQSLDATGSIEIAILGDSEILRIFDDAWGSGKSKKPNLGAPPKLRHVVLFNEWPQGPRVTKTIDKFIRGRNSAIGATRRCTDGTANQLFQCLAKIAGALRIFACVLRVELRML